MQMLFLSTSRILTMDAIRPFQAGDGSYNRIAGTFFLLAMLCFTPALTVITMYETERKLIAREYASGMYSLPAYYLAKTLISWPVEIFLCLMVTCVSYFMIGAFSYLHTKLCAVLCAGYSTDRLRHNTSLS